MQKKCYWYIPVVIVVLLGLVSYLIVFSIQYFNTTSLISAIEREDIAKVEELLDKGVDPNLTDLTPNKLWDLFEYTPKRPLSVACSTANVEIVKLLINYGATAEFITGTGFSPLRETLFYCQPNDVEIISLLLENGAGTEEKFEGNTVFIAAQMIPRIYDNTKENGTIFSSGYDKTTAEEITKIVFLLLGDQSINITNNSGETLLMLSVKTQNLFLAEHLLSQGADAPIKNINGETALDYALETGNNALISILSQSG